jgi:hypothetical protein
MVYLIGFYTKEDLQAQSAGVYVTKAHMQVFDNFREKKVVHWIGTDILQLYKNASYEKLEVLRKWFKDNKIIHLSEANFTQRELRKLGIKSKVVPIPSTKFYEQTPLPEEFSVAVYMPFVQDNQGKASPDPTYCPNITDAVIRSMPDVKFYFYGADQVKGQKKDNWEYLGYIDMESWMPRFSCNLRLTVHDGLPISCLEFLSAGRSVVTTVPLKGAIYTDLDRKNIVEAIRKAQRGFNSKGMKYARKLTPERYKKQIWRLK